MKLIETGDPETIIQAELELQRLDAANNDRKS
jgi:hypothetical protein